MGILDLQQVQVGKESTRGTVVTPTARLMGIEDISIQPVREVAQYEERRGSLAPAYNSALEREGAEGSISGLVTYEDIPYWLDSLIGEATPTGTNPYTYSYSAPLTSEPSPRILSIVYGDSTRAYGATGVLVSSLTISGGATETLRFSADLVGHDVATDSLESLSDRSITEVMTSQATLYIDAWGGTIGSTAISNSLYNFELTISSNRANKWYVGASTPGGYREARWETTLTLALELDATTDDYLNDILSSSPLQKLVRIKATSGTKSFQLDFAGTATEAPVIFDDEDGVVTIGLSLSGEYESGLANYFKAEVVNAVSSLP